MKKFCIVVPIYHEDIYDYEEISLKRLHDIIYDKGYDVFFIYPNGLNIDKYLELYNTANLISMDNDFFTDIHSYSQLMLNYNFYNMFSMYQYMLIYQTDSYLFKDEIEEWCNKGYDYIGAPIISSLKIWEQDNVNDWTPKVGNGGLSLRRIAIFKDITNPNGSFYKSLNINPDLLNDVIHEDVYFCTFVPKYYIMNIPNWLEAAYFSLSLNPIEIYNIIDNQPMGCHNFNLYKDFWKEHGIDELK